MKSVWGRGFLKLSSVSLRLHSLIFKVISGQHLPRPDGESDGEVIDPYVKVRIRGHPDDENSNNKRKTEHVKNNGFHPVWDAGYFKFHVKVPQVAFIEFKVKDHSRSGSDKDIGSHVCPVEALQEGCLNTSLFLAHFKKNISRFFSLGYRRVYLEDYSGKRLTPASLLVKIALSRG